MLTGGGGGGRKIGMKKLGLIYLVGG